MLFNFLLTNQFVNVIKRSPVHYFFIHNLITISSLETNNHSLEVTHGAILPIVNSNTATTAATSRIRRVRISVSAFGRDSAVSGELVGVDPDGATRAAARAQVGARGAVGCDLTVHEKVA